MPCLRGRIDAAGRGAVPGVPVPGLDRAGRLRHGQPAGPGRLWDRPRPLQRLRVRPRRRADPDAQARGDRHQGHPGGRRPDQPRTREGGLMRVPLSLLLTAARLDDATPDTPPDEIAPPLTAAGLDGHSGTHAGLRDSVPDIEGPRALGCALPTGAAARDVATAYGTSFADPAGAGLPEDVAAVSPEIYPASIEDPSACDRFVLREVRGFDPNAPTPLWMRVRLARSGMRRVSLAVDVTNYLMLEMGQPLHAFDRSRLTGPIVVRRARPGERLETLDHVVRELDPDDILITDSSGPISMASTIGGLATEISTDSRDLVIEAAHFDQRGTARMSRRHKLFSEASYRFERGVDRELPIPASAKARSLLASLGSRTAPPGLTHAFLEVPQRPI